MTFAHSPQEFAKPLKNLALRFVVLMGIVNLFADMTYEGGRGEVGAFLGSLGSAA